MQKKKRKKKWVSVFMIKDHSYGPKNLDLFVFRLLKILLHPIHDQDHSYGPKTLDLFVSIMSSEL